MKKRRKYSIRRFQCPICGTIHTASKSRGKTGNGHLKKIWPYKCNAEVNMTQIDSDLCR